MRYGWDRTARRAADGRVLIGGRPRRVTVLTPAGREVVDRALGVASAAAPAAGPRGAEAALLERLVEGGVLHPLPLPRPPTPGEVGVVIPVRDDAEGVARLLRGLSGHPGPIVVVDDGSLDPTPLREICEGAGVEWVRRGSSGGPAAARTAGLARILTPLVAFLDADVEVSPGWCDPLLGHFDDPRMAAVGPRIRSLAGPGLLAAVESGASPLDMGPDRGGVRPGTPIAYLPSAALVVRREALLAAGGFDVSLRFGEDVDLLWRLLAAGHRVRYEPAAEVAHRPRPTWAAWARQRYAYGTSAAPLHLRHRSEVPAAVISPVSALVWAGIGFGGRRGVAAGAVLAAATASSVPSRLPPFPGRRVEGLRLGMEGHLAAGAGLARSLWRPWWPLGLLGTVVGGGRVGRVMLVSAGVAAADRWVRARPPVDPLRWTAACVAEDVAYSAGVWAGAWRYRTGGPLLPRIVPVGRGRVRRNRRTTR